jgi:hypothetical protein
MMGDAERATIAFGEPSCSLIARSEALAPLWSGRA